MADNEGEPVTPWADVAAEAAAIFPDCTQEIYDSYEQHRAETPAAVIVPDTHISDTHISAEAILDHLEENGRPLPNRIGYVGRDGRTVTIDTATIQDRSALGVVVSIQGGPSATIRYTPYPLPISHSAVFYRNDGTNPERPNIPGAQWYPAEPIGPRPLPYMTFPYIARNLSDDNRTAMLIMADMLEDEYRQSFVAGVLRVIVAEDDAAKKRQASMNQIADGVGQEINRTFEGVGGYGHYRSIPGQGIDTGRVDITPTPSPEDCQTIMAATNSAIANFTDEQQPPVMGPSPLLPALRTMYRWGWMLARWGLGRKEGKE